jgi:excisionase family DNA binding protein
MSGARLLTVAQVSDYLQVPVQTLYLWHHKGTGPSAIKVGRHLRYRECDLDAWVESLVSRNRARSRPI